MTQAIAYPFTDLLQQAGARPPRNGRKWHCPHCPEGSNPALSVDGEAFYCHRCGWCGGRKALEREMGIAPRQRTDKERREWRRVDTEAARVEAWWSWRYRFLRDFNWLLGDIERLAAESGREALARGEEVPECVWASLDFAIQNRRKIWLDLIFLGDPERNAHAIIQRYRESKAA